MATGTTALDLVVIYAAYRRPGNGTVAGFTLDAAVDMARRLAGSGFSVVAARAIAFHGGVIEHGIAPGSAAVAITAVLSTLYMIRALSGCGLAVMTALTAALDREMIDLGHILPVLAGMAELAVLGGIHVLR